MFVDPCFIVQFILKKIQQGATIYQHFFISYLYETQHVLGDTSFIIRSLKLHWQPVVFHTWKVDGRVVGGRCQAQCAWWTCTVCAWQRPPTTLPTTFHIWKNRGCQYSYRLLTMGGVSPETCWASYKYGIIKFWYIVASCWIFLYELENHYCFSGEAYIVIQHSNESNCTHIQFIPKRAQWSQYRVAY
jgi:hypothetical protein